MTAILTATGVASAPHVLTGGLGRASGWFDVAVSELPDRLIPGEFATLTIKDMVVDSLSAGQVATDYELDVSIQDRPVIASPAIVVGDGGGVTQDLASPYIFRSAVDGESTRVTVEDPAVRTVDLDLVGKVRTVSQPTTEFKGWATGSAARASTDALDGLIAGKLPDTAKTIYSWQDHAAGVYVRNPDCWVQAIDLTGISAWQSSSGSRLCVTLVTRRHAIMAAHAMVGVGATVRFVSTSNETIERTVVARERLPDYTGAPYHEQDLALCVFDSDLPSSITHIAALGGDWASYLPSMAPSAATRGRIPALATDQEGNALVTDWERVTTSASARFRVPADAQRALFYEPLIGGDSSNPGLLIIGNTPVLLTVWTFGGAGQGTMIGDYVTELNALIATLDAAAGISTGYTLTQFNFNNFPSYD